MAGFVAVLVLRRVVVRAVVRAVLRVVRVLFVLFPALAVLRALRPVPAVLRALVERLPAAAVRRRGAAFGVEAVLLSVVAAAVGSPELLGVVAMMSGAPGLRVG